jgi:hypothetical protein
VRFKFFILEDTDDKNGSFISDGNDLLAFCLFYSLMHKVVTRHAKFNEKFEICKFGVSSKVGRVQIRGEVTTQLLKLQLAIKLDYACY